jgi:hypothetical protein
MKSSDKKKFKEVLEDAIMRKTGYISDIEVRRDYTSTFQYEIVSIHCVSVDGHEFFKSLPLSCKTIYETEWPVIAEKIIEHLEFNKVSV